MFMSSIGRVTFVVCSIAAMTACGPQSVTPSNPVDTPGIADVRRANSATEMHAAVPSPLPAPDSSTTPTPKPTATPKYGVTITGTSRLEIENANEGDNEYDYFSCQGVSESTQGCSIDFGLKTSTYSNSKSVTNKHAGTLAVKQSATQSMASMSYSLDVSVDGAESTSADQSYASETSQSVDELTANSKTLPRGTNVSFGVALVLTPKTTAVDCSAPNIAFNSGNVSFTGTATSDAEGNQTLAVSGSCGGGMDPFQYEAWQGDSIAPGATTDTRTLTVAIGEKTQISLGASADVNVCTPSYSCNEPYEAELAGNVKYEITSVPSGVTYTTASGNRYTP